MGPRGARGGMGPRDVCGREGIPTSAHALRVARKAVRGEDGRFRLVNKSRGTTLAARVEVAASPWARAVGAMGRRSLPEGFGLVLAPCASVHTVLVRVDLDIAYLDGDGVVLRVATLAPWSIGPRVPGSRAVVEVPAGAAARSGTRPGDRIVLVWGESSVAT